MKNVCLLGITILLVFISACTANTSSNSKVDTKNISAVSPMSTGTNDNPVARQEYNLIRTVNPQTGLLPLNITKSEYEFVNGMAINKSASNNQWYSQGPYNVGGRTRAMAIDVANENRIIAGGVSGGVYIVDEIGNNFQKATTSLMLHSVTCIAQDKRTGHQNKWYYGTGELSGNSSDLVGHGIYRSEDNGLTWTLLPNTANEVATNVSATGDFSYVTDIVVHPSTGQIVASTFAGIFVSDNEGASWNNVLTADGSPNGFNYINFGNQTNIYVTNSGVYYASLSSDAQNSGIWRSEDGVNWSEITPTGFDASYRRIEMAAAPSNESIVYFVVDESTDPFTDEHGFWKYTFLSGDGSGAGGSWEDRSANLPNGQCTGFYDFDFGYYQTQNSYDMCIAVYPSDENQVFIGGTNLYRSNDAFATASGEWFGGYQCDTQNPSNYIWPNHHPDNHIMLFSPSDPRIMYSAHDGGISRTSDCLAAGIQWESLNKFYNTSQFYTVAIEQGNANSEKIIGGLQDNGTWLTNTFNSTSDWKDVFYGDGAYCAIAEGGNDYYVSWQGGKTFKFAIDDNGTTTGLTRIDPIGGDDYLFINPFILDPSDNNVMYLAGGQFIWKNDNLSSIPLLDDEYNAISTGWTKILESDITPTFPGTPVPVITTVEMSKASQDVLYYGTWNGLLYKLEGLINGPIDRSSIQVSSMPTNAYVSCIESNPNNEDEIVVTFSNYEVRSIFQTENAGSDWTNVSGSLEENPDGSGAGPSANWAHIYNEGGSTRYYVGTTSGLFSTTILDGVNTEWEREGEFTIGNIPVSMITSREEDSLIVVSTHGGGVFSNYDFPIAIEDASEGNGFYSSLPYPNQVTDRMKLHISSENNTDVEVDLYNLTGQHVANIYAQENFVGSKDLKWYRSVLSNGHYLLVIKSNNKTITHHIQLH